MQKAAKADVTPVRQRTQYSCMSASMCMCLRALGYDCTEDEVNKVMGARPMKGAAWEQALACAQHYGCRATLTTPATVKQLKAWTDQGIPVMIAWNPEGRDWSHASVVFDVDDDGNVHVADPNLPDPEETVRIVPKGEFYKKWFEKWPRYLVRRPALAIEREITPEGRQVMASVKKASSMLLPSTSLVAARFGKTASPRPDAGSTSLERVSSRYAGGKLAGDLRDSFLTQVFSPGFDTKTRFAGKMDFQAVFMMGPPGAGKSYIKEMKYLRHTGFRNIDSDEMKKKHPEYNPEHPERVHSWSTKEQVRELLRVLPSGEPFVYDGTGWNPVPVKERMEWAKDAGYRIFLVYVYVPIPVSLFRNRNRDRFLPERVILTKAEKVHRSFGVLKRVADKFHVVLNFTEAQLQEAEADMKVYPPPQQSRPPRPGDPNYGVGKQASVGDRTKRVDGYYMSSHEPMPGDDSDNYESVNKWDPQARRPKPMTEVEVKKVVSYLDKSGVAWLWEKVEGGKVVAESASRSQPSRRRWS